MASGITWTVAPRALGAQITTKIERTRADIEQLVRGVVDDGANDMRRFILAAVTKTGQERAATGAGKPGRYETGTMYDAVSSDVKTFGDETVGEFGWLNLVLDYFMMQEEGTSRIEAMHALQQAFTNASEQFQLEINQLVRTNFA